MGISQRKIASKLMKSQPCICKFLKKFNSTDSYEQKPGSGRRRKLTQSEEKKIVQLARKKTQILNTKDQRIIEFDKTSDKSNNT